ncbi:MAG TPA: protein kinase, partial [Terriglobales bacterium]|nr:protein kinase [Terriglobales bacterium]
LKPANIMLTKAGAKLMDFGLAKQSGPAPLAQALNDMTMEHSKLTGAGIIVGTFQYMAPEQLEGKEADARTDIFALGEVIYEMATGKAAFAGNSRASLIAAIMSTDPTPMSQVQPLTPPALERTVRKCLAKDPEDRWQSASDLASDLKWMAESGSQAGVPAPVAAKGTRRDLLPWAVVVLAVIGAIAFAAIRFLGGAKPAAVIRASILVEEGTFPILTGDFAGPPMLSPDGKNLAYVAAKEQGAAMLWLRPLSGTHAQVLPGTEGAIFPFWSPDGRNLGFFANGKLKTVSIEGGTPAEVCSAPFARGGTWNAQGTIVFAPDFQSVLQQVPAAGGTPKPATVMDSKHDSHRWPVFLPDGRHFLYLAVTHSNNRDPNDGIYLASLDGKENHLVMQGLTNVAYADGRLLFARDNALMAQPFDAKAGTPQGEAQRVSEDVLIDGTIWRAQFDVSHDLLAYVSGGLTPWQARWYDRSGKQLESIGDQVVNLVAVRLSPDGTRLATEAGETKSDIWVYDRKREVNTRLTFGAGTDASSSPVWSPDGKWIAYSGIRHLKNNILRKPVSGGGAEEVLLEG